MNVFFLWEWEAWGEVGAVGAMFRNLFTRFKFVLNFYP